MPLWVYLWIGWACHCLRYSVDVLKDMLYTLWPISFQLTSIQLLSSFPSGVFFLITSCIKNHFDALLWWTSVGLLNYCQFACHNEKKYKIGVYLLKIDLMKNVGDLRFDVGAWRLNVGVCGFNASMCSFQLCFVWFRGPLIFHFWLAALRRTWQKHWKSLDTLKPLLDFVAEFFFEFVSFMRVEVVVLFTVYSRCLIISDSFWLSNRRWCVHIQFVWSVSLHFSPTASLFSGVFFLILPVKTVHLFD